MAVTAIIGAGVQIYQGIQALSSGGKEDERLAANQQAYQEAIGGDLNALEFLRARSVANVVVTVPGYGEVGGWATETARADAKTKYEQAKAILDAKSTGSDIFRSSTAQQAAQFTGNTIVPGTQGQIGVVVIVAAAALFFLARKTKR